MIQRVYEQCVKCSVLDKVIVATDDERILNHIHDFGGEAVMTSPHHQSGTDRCAEVAASYTDYEIVVNIQGDEPYIDPVQIAKVVTCFQDSNTQIATLVKKINDVADLPNVNSPKVLINKLSEAIYFSRTALPYLRGIDQAEWLQYYSYFKHIGIYGFKSDILQQVTKLPLSPLEKAEGLEQLRWIENGFHIKVAETDLETQAVDTPDDLKKLVSQQKN